VLPQTPNSAPTHNLLSRKPDASTHQAPRGAQPLLSPAAPPSRRCHHDLEGVSPPGKNTSVAVAHSATQPHKQ